VPERGEVWQVDYGNRSYDTCAQTYSTLRIFADDLSPDQISEALQVHPTRQFRKGDLHCQGRLQRKINGWFYSTETLSDSNDGRHHLDMLLSILEGKVDSIGELRNRGCQLDIVSYWVSTGQGGPWLMPRQMLELGKLGLEVWWDIYFQSEEETQKVASETDLTSRQRTA
jgi:hypothetical protein